MAISTLRTKRSRPMRLIGDPLNMVRKPASSRAASSARLGARQFGTGAQLVVRRGTGEAVPRADRQAVVAAVDAIAHQRAEFVRDRAVMFDGEVGDAARRIEPVRRGERIGRADVEAARAGAAVVRVRLVGRDIERGVDLAQEQPGAMGARDEVGVLALPADPGALRQRLLHHRRGIDETFTAGPKRATMNCARCFSMPFTTS